MVYKCGLLADIWGCLGPEERYDEDENQCMASKSD